MTEEIEPRITSPQVGSDGRRLRFKAKGQQPFRGKPGKPHPRQGRLDARRTAHDAKRISGRKRPGSYKK